MPPRDKFPLQGVTIDAGNGVVRWGSIEAAGADFAYIFATGGDARVDPAYARNMAAAREAGIRTGPIHRYSRSEEHTSELQSLMRISYAVFCLKKKKNKYKTQ